VRNGTHVIGLLDKDSDLALEIEICPVSVFEDVGLHSCHQVSQVLGVVQEVSVLSTSSLIDEINSVSLGVINVAGVDDHAESVNGLRIASPFMIDLLSNDGIFDRILSGLIQNFISAYWHGNLSRSNVSGKHADFQFGADSLVRFHVEALDAVGPVYLGDEQGMEGDDDSGGDKDSLGVEGPGPSGVALIERQSDPGNLPPSVLTFAVGLSEKTLYVDLSLELVSSVEVDGDRGRSAFDFGLPLDVVVDGDGPDAEGESKEEESLEHHSEVEMEGARWTR
jgi:hypothetical protein